MGKKETLIPIVFICEEINIKSLLVALVSLFENAGEGTTYDVNILSKLKYSNSNEEVFDKLNIKYNCQIKLDSFYEINKGNHKDIIKTISDYYVMLDKCIYLDFNVVVQKDLTELFNFNLENNSFGAVRQIDDNINSNVLLIDCNSTDEYSIKEIDLKYNLQAYLLKGEKSFNFGKQVKINSEMVSKFNRKQFIPALRDNVIFSYTDDVNPLTIDNCSFTVEWWKYFRLSPLCKVKKLSPKVSVIIPVYNVEQYISECLDSVINQTLGDIEIILVDDGSTDNSLKIMFEYANIDSRITILQQENQGAGVARNKGLDIAKGEYLSFLDPDDFFELTMLEQTYNKAKSTDVDIVVFDYLMFNQSTGKFIPTSHKLPNSYEIFSYKDLKYNIFSSLHDQAWNKIFKRDFIKENNLRFQHLFRTNDVYFTNSAVACAKSITVLDKKLAYYRVGTKNNAQATLHLHPLSFYTAELGLRDKLKEIGIYEEVEQGFLNKVLNDSFGNMQRNKNVEAIKTIYNHLKDNLDKDFGITMHPREYYNSQLLAMFMFVINNSFENYIKNKNSN